MKPCLLALGIQTALPITLQARHDAASGDVVKSKKEGSLAPTELKLKADNHLSCQESEMARPSRGARGMGFASRWGRYLVIKKSLPAMGQRRVTTTRPSRNLGGFVIYLAVVPRGWA